MKEVMRRVKFPAWVLIHLLLPIMLSACSGGSNGPCDANKKQPNVDDPPIYPNALNVQRGYFSPRSDQIRTTIFETKDKPDKVLAFYKVELLKDGWEVSDVHLPANEFAVHWSNCCSYAWLDVTATLAETGDTKVTIEHPLAGHCTD